MKKISILFVVVALATITGRAQTSFRDLIPGVSTRDDVGRSLGTPVSNAGKSIVQYPAPAGMARVEVEFDGKNVAQRIEVHLDPPVTRRALAQKYGLAASDARKAKSGRLVEYFAGDTLVSFTYVGSAEATGVSSVGHFSRRSFSSASGVKLPEDTVASAPGSGGRSKTEKTLAILGGLAQLAGTIQQLRRGQNGWSTSNQATLEGTYLSQYQAGSAEQCQADCGANGSCRAFVFVRAGNPNPGDPAMCYLMSNATRVVQSPCCAAGVKGAGL